jgi:hypothetical protein
MKKISILFAAIIAATTIQAQTVKADISFFRTAISTLEEKGVQSFNKEQFTADAPKHSTKDGGKQFYRLTAIDVPANVCFWPNKEIALHKTYAPDKNVFNLGLRFVRNDEDNMFLLAGLEAGDIITICANVEPKLFSKSTCVTLQSKEDIPSEDFVYGNKHRTFPMQQFTYTVTRAGDQAFLMDYGKILYSVKVVKP